MEKQDEVTVYLDHLITRESLRYRRPVHEIRTDDNARNTLALRQLFEDDSSRRVKLLRKPDFQRATWAWTPDECVSLLESVINEQVIPSIVMWSSPDNDFDYILDGAHRVSVVLAWLNDSWGDHLPEHVYGDAIQANRVKRAAQIVRQRVVSRIGSIHDYKMADERFEIIALEGREIPREVLDETTFQRATFYRRLRRDQVYFHILWVKGDYRRAEQSFLKINQTGRQLSGWETKLVENRNSSLARLVMATANVATSEHYWPLQLEDGPVDQEYKDRIEQIRDGVVAINKVLFVPPYRSQITQLQQPYLVAPDEPTKPAYLAELFTIIEGGRGQEPETNRLLQMDANAAPKQIIDNGLVRIGHAAEVFSHLTGTSSRSLGIVPLLYFYTEGGRYTRHLLYGFLYWLFCDQSDENVLTRKRLLCSHRESFERVLRRGKEVVVSGLTRKTGSGADVTRQAGQYFQDILELVIRHNDQDESVEFKREYKQITKKFLERRMQDDAASEPGGRSRQATGRQRRTIKGQAFLNSAVRCEICEGILDPASHVEYDHVQPWHNQGATILSNLRMTHPFCNNQRQAIETIRAGQASPRLPSFLGAGRLGTPRQLQLIDLSDFDQYPQVLGTGADEEEGVDGLSGDIGE